MGVALVTQLNPTTRLNQFYSIYIGIYIGCLLGNLAYLHARGSHGSRDIHHGVAGCIVSAHIMHAPQDSSIGFIWL
jgi:hypothetical protein